MRYTITVRKSLFKAALALEGKTAKQFAAEQNVTPGHLSMTLNGRESKKLTDAIDSFIRSSTGLKRPAKIAV